MRRREGAEERGRQDMGARAREREKGKKDVLDMDVMAQESLVDLRRVGGADKKRGGETDSSLPVGSRGGEEEEEGTGKPESCDPLV